MSKNIEEIEEIDMDLLDIEECPSCGYEGAYTEGIEENTYIKICPICKNTFAVEIHGK